MAFVLNVEGCKQHTGFHGNDQPTAAKSSLLSYNIQRHHHISGSKRR